MRKTFLTAVIALVLLAAPAAFAEAPALGIDLTHASRYIWRGIPINEDPVLQPSVTWSNAGFAMIAWANIDTTDWGKEEGGYGDKAWSITEIDYVAKYEKRFGKLITGLGFATYSFPNTPWSSTTEVNYYLGLDVPLSPVITYSADVDGPWSAPASYLALDLGHSFTLWEEDDRSVALAFGGHVGRASNELINNYFLVHEGDKWQDWSATVKLPLSLGAGFYLVPAYSYSSLIDEDLRDVVEDEWDRDAETGWYSISLGWGGEVNLDENPAR